MSPQAIGEKRKNLLSMKKFVAVLEVTIFEALFFIFAWMFAWIYPSSYGWYSKFIMITLGAIGILIHRDIRNYGLSLKNLKFSVKWSIYISLLFSIIIIITLVTSYVAGFLKTEIDTNLLLINAVWYFIFVGFAEEFFFRGYIQSRLNEVFTKKYKRIIGVDFEWHQGTLITGVCFFGIPHILVGVNPFMGLYKISWTIIILVISASFLGVIFGAIREKTGDIIIPTILHGLIDFTVYVIGKVIGLALSNLITIIAIFLFLAFMFERILKEPLNK